MDDFSGKIALVTGASRGIGKAIALALAEAGAYVIVNYVSNKKAAGETMEEIRRLGGHGETFRANVQDAENVEAMFQHIRTAHGKLDILVNNAAILSRVPFLEMSLDEWERVMDGNVRGYFLCGQQAARMMVERGYGRIINISSISQYQAAVNRSHYCTSKGAIGMLTKCMALELAGQGITVNSVVPGSIHTDFNNDVLSDPQYYAECLRKIPAGRLGCAADVVPPVMMLASDEAGYITGASVAVDGGVLVQ